MLASPQGNHLLNKVYIQLDSLVAEDGNLKLSFENTDFKINRINTLEDVKINRQYHSQFKLKWVIEGCQLSHKDHQDRKSLCWTFILHFFERLVM